MITFYPRDIGRWREHFDFYPPITLTPKVKTNYQVFRDRAEFIEFLREHKIQLDNPEFPLRFESCKEVEAAAGNRFPAPGELFEVIQWTVQGWFRDDYK